MITGLALSNFKSIGKTLIVNDEDIAEGKLEFAPLTILCGKNSSGKSTVLQSVLLLAQTLQNNVPSQTLVLNGPMVKFGSVDDIKSNFSTLKDIVIDIDFNITKSEKEILELLKSNLCVEEEISIQGHKHPFKYSLSNNLDEIKKAILNRTENYIDLSEVEWKLNPALSENVKDLMNKYNVIYSMTTWHRTLDKEEVKCITVNKRCGYEWFIVTFYEKNGKIYGLEQSEVFSYGNHTDEKTNQNINIQISFNKKASIAISNIIPIIEQIYFQIKNIFISTDFTALHRNKNKEIITKDNDFEYYKLDMNKEKLKDGPLGKLKLVGLRLHHFLPEKIIYVCKISDIYAKYRIIKLFNDFTGNEYLFSNRSVNDYNNTIKILLIDEIDKQKTNKKIELENFTIPENVKINNKQDFIFYVEKFISKIIKIAKLISNKKYLMDNKKNIGLDPEFDDNYHFPYITISDQLEPTVHDGINDITNYFQNNIKYIGPLREEPHLQYNEYIDNLDNIGIKGEKCAAVFYHRKNEIITYINPWHFEQSTKIIETQKEKLNSALNEWLNYMGVSWNVDVSYNRHGYELKVESISRYGYTWNAEKKKLDSDLTNVGVGVSQILPIILACLLAPEESTIIIEQPELHLHPAMQTKLTDFFIATMLCNKQLIIETHSEYIINQLRLRVVNCPTKEPINDKLMVYFTDNLKEDNKEYKAGNTTFRKLEINEYAAMSDWPEGFFDESSKTAKQIMNEVIKKMEDNSQND